MLRSGDWHQAVFVAEVEAVSEDRIVWNSNYCTF